ncbi:MAG: DUF5777 family beta-barrel protein [Bacteroidales bacterium]|jgi:hypothetical protein|nr:DUF5777 family beta-barrel protein [Bacteroidales bacterium]
MRIILNTKFSLLLTAFFSVLACPVNYGQDLDALLSKVSSDETPDFIYGIFKGTTIINGQSVELAGNNDLRFLVSHRFGAVNGGLYNFFGLDQGTTRLGFEYGIKDRMSFIIGRSSYEKTYDGGIKLKILNQQKGPRNIPVAVAVYSAFFANTMRWEDPERENLFSSRFAYSTQLLAARKFNKNLSLQISPSFVHFNLVRSADDQNNIFSLGFGGRYKLGSRFSVNGEYFWLFPGLTSDDYANSLSLGVDIETGGHVFQLHCTNSQLMFAPGYIARSDGKWTDGNVFFGFNIYRNFSLGRKNESGSEILIRP